MMSDPIPSLAGRVKQLREAAGLSQQALAQAAGLSISVVTQLEQGVKADPRISTVAALARALGVSVDSLISQPAATDAPGPAAPKGRKDTRRRK
jgi:transcriptional regulator with XRE-family HTH domain